MDDFFILKVVSFKSKCRLLGLPDYTLIRAFQIILIGDTKTYYFNNIECIRNILTFDDIMRKVKSYFENKSIEQFYLHY